MIALLLTNFIISLIKSVLWIFLGILFIKHFETASSYIIRKPIPEKLISKKNKNDFIELMKWIGVCFLFIGIISIIMAITTISIGGHQIKF